MVAWLPIATFSAFGALLLVPIATPGPSPAVTSASATFTPLHNKTTQSAAMLLWLFTMPLLCFVRFLAISETTTYACLAWLQRTRYTLFMTIFLSPTGIIKFSMNFIIPPPRFLVKMFSRNFSYQDKEKSEPVMPGAKISSTMSPQHSFTVLFSRNKKGRDRSYPQLRSLSFLFKPFISQYDCRTHHGNLSLLCYRHYSRAHVLLYDDRCLCQKCGLHGNDMPPELLRFPV